MKFLLIADSSPYPFISIIRCAEVLFYVCYRIFIHKWFRSMYNVHICMFTQNPIKLNLTKTSGKVEIFTFLRIFSLDDLE